ncbi:uncharacterized protein METZ01_LOCUS193397, partial [marine metagenome]
VRRFGGVDGFSAAYRHRQRVASQPRHGGGAEGRVERAWRTRPVTAARGGTQQHHHLQDRQHAVPEAADFPWPRVQAAHPGDLRRRTGRAADLPAPLQRLRRRGSRAGGCSCGHEGV